MVIIGVAVAKMALVRKVSSISKLPNWWNSLDMGSVCLSHQETVTSKCREQDVRKKGLVNALETTEGFANEVRCSANTQLNHIFS